MNETKKISRRKYTAEFKAKVADPEGSGLTPSELKTAIEGSMSSGAAGICLFTPDRMTPEHWEVFEKVVKDGVGK